MTLFMVTLTKTQMKSKTSTFLLKWLDKHTHNISFEGVDEAVLRGFCVRKDANSDTAVLFLNGRGDNIFQYAEFYYDLINQLGCHLYTFDHRGQGYSSRLTKNRWKGHVSSYDDYVADVETFFVKFIKPKSYKKIILVGHSMGGGIGVLWASQTTQIINKMYLSAPMFEVESPIPSWIAKPALSLLCLFGMSKLFLIGSPGKPSIGAFGSNKLTKDKERYELMCELNRMTDGNPILVRPTNGWGLATFKASDKINKLIKNLDCTEGTIFQAGEEQYIKNNAHKSLLPLGWKTILLDNQYHQLLHSEDKARNIIINTIVEDWKE